MTKIPHLDYDDHDAYKRAFETWHCPHCEQLGLDQLGAEATTGGSSDHYAGVRCRNRGHWLNWLPWPPRSKAEEKSKRRIHVVKADDDFCEHCTLTREEADELGVQLEVRHRRDRADLIDAGLPPDEPEELTWICAPGCKGDEIAARARVNAWRRTRARARQ